MEIKRTDSVDPDFGLLTARLDAYLTGVNGDTDDFYRQYNKPDKINHTVVIYLDGVPAACGGIRPYSGAESEVKRMYVEPMFRGKGLAKRILTELENWSRELGFTTCILETGRTMADALALYEGSGYRVTPNYEPYVGVDFSVCMKKAL